MRMTSSKCVLKQRHLLGYDPEPEPRDPNPNPILPNRNIVSEMTYTVSSGTLNSSIPYHT